MTSGRGNLRDQFGRANPILLTHSILLTDMRRWLSGKIADKASARILERPGGGKPAGGHCDGTGLLISCAAMLLQTLTKI